MTDKELMQQARDKRLLLQQALEALELLAWCENPATRVQVRKPRNGGKVATEAAAPLRERLAQPDQLAEGLTVGNFTLSRYDEGSYWLAHKDGEGMQVRQDRLQALVDNLWADFRQATDKENLMRPATHSTDDPPCKIDNVELAEYVQMLRRRIELQNDFIENYASQQQAKVEKLNTEIEKLSIDLGIRDQHMAAGTWVEVKTT